MKTSNAFLGRCMALIMAANSPLLLAQTPPAQHAPPGPPGPPTMAPGADPGPPPSVDQTSYLFGLTFGAQLRSVGITGDLNNEAISRGLKDAMGGREPTNAEMQQLQSYVRSIAEATAARNRAAATDYLARNAKEKGVVTTPSGLQYKVLNPGNKAAPPITASDQVTVQYRGKLLDGTEFDSSYARGVPATFPVTGVIKGWQEALVLMKPGAKYQLFIPPDLAYGSVPKPKIPAGSMLIFEVDVVSAQSPAAPAAPKSAAPMPAPKPTTPPGNH
jgi:FKBP-type peptidyl-prolyl cis-trans isomerase